MPATRGYFCGLQRHALLGTLLLTMSAPQAPAKQAPSHIPAAEIDSHVIASLPKWHGNSADIVHHLDLTHAFGTRVQWTFVVAKLPLTRPNAFGETVDRGPLAVCFVRKLTPQCTYSAPHRAPFWAWISTVVHLYSAKVVFAGADRTHPLLLVKSGSPSGVDGGHAIYTQLYTYDRCKNKFKSVFSNSVGSNNNQETRFVRHGPLRGDIIVARPTSSAPYAYRISVYAWNRKAPYSHRVLRYRSNTRYGDGNPLAVIDSEMPNILRDLGEWRPSDPLPIPRHLPSRCTHHLFLRRGEEWCRQE